MITLRCDNCEKTLEVPDDLAGKKVKCPACGDVNIVPVVAAAAIPTPAAAAGPDRAAAAGQPPASGSEERVMFVRRAMFRARLGRFLLLLLALIGGAAGTLYFTAVSQAQSREILSIACAAVGLVALVILAVWRFLSLGETLEITTKRTIEKTGILSKSTVEIMHRDIRGIQIHQSFAQRLLGVGQLTISSAAEDDHEILAKDVPSPKKVRDVIDLYRPT